MAKSIREAYGEALATYAAGHPDVVVLDADVSGSTQTALFAQACPERFYNVGIAEANMAGMACGFAAGGKIPFINTFAAFITSNCLLALRMASYSHLNVKVMGAYGGLSDSYDGPSHHSFDDISIMRGLPGFTVVVPCDEHAVASLVKSELERQGPLYCRLSREAMPEQYRPGSAFAVGRANLLRQGRDVTLIACGLMVSRAVGAACALAKEGISARVLDMFTVKPIDRTAILEAAMQTGAIVTAEEHSRYGGLASAISEVLAQSGTGVPMEVVAIDDRHAESGAYEALLEKYGLTEADIVRAARRAVQNKSRF